MTDMKDIDLKDFSKRLNETLFDETIEIIKSFKAYITEVIPMLKQNADVGTRLLFTKTTLQLTQIILQDLAWCAGFRAYKNKEVSLDEALRLYGNLPEMPEIPKIHPSFDVYVDKIDAHHSRIMNFIRSLA